MPDIFGKELLDKSMILVPDYCDEVSVYEYGDINREKQSIYKQSNLWNNPVANLSMCSWSHMTNKLL